MWNPWRSIPDGWTVTYATLPGDVCGITDTTRRVITLDPILTQTQRRCTLAHEIEHAKAGHVGPQPAAIERAVELAAARRLIELADLADALRWTRDLHELAEVLWVDASILAARLDALTDDERQQLG